LLHHGQSLGRGSVKFYQTKEFLKLQKNWAKKLKESGFEDLEPREGDKLPGEINVRRENARPLRILSTLEYYSQASKFLWDFNFKTEREKQIWLYYSEGKTYREIAVIMGDKSHMLIHKTINEIKPIFLTYVKAQWEFDNDDE
jgi:hypothetical protein